MNDYSSIPLLYEDSITSEYDDFREDVRSSSEFVRKDSPHPVIASTISPLRSFLWLASVRPLSIRCGTQISQKYRLLVSLLNLGVFTVLLLVVTSIADAILHPSYSNPPAHYAELERHVHDSSRLGRGNLRNEQIFIASSIIQADLIRNTWGPALIRLVELLGPENVFVSIYENDSGPSTSAALQQLKAQLPCEHSVVTGAHLPLSDFPSMNLPNGQRRVKRITYLSHIRNQLLAPLQSMQNGSSSGDHEPNRTSRHFDRILFLNDIYFDPVEALQLLFSTNKNALTSYAEYDVACAADFVASVMFYDTFVVRDLEGYGMGLMFFPWFTSNGRGESRKDVLAQKDNVRVLSCWGGMVAFAAAPFLQPNTTIEQNAPLRFRHQKELYWEASECCLLNADLAAMKADAKIFLNPYVRVAYDARSWSRLPFIRRIERVFVTLQGIVSWIGYPEFNPRRVEHLGDLSSQLRWVYTKPHMNGEAFRNQSETVATGDLDGEWKVTKEPATPGGFCGQRRLFLMRPDIQSANKAIEQTGRNWEKGPWPLQAR